GFPPENRPFTAHVTLARIKDPAKAARIGAALRALDPAPSARFEARTVELMKSQPGPGGSAYTALASLPFGRAGAS
ncbi:MAG: 2'-5' RNA ligase family protein, partial [Myxococcales bacterium]